MRRLLCVWIIATCAAGSGPLPNFVAGLNGLPSNCGAGCNQTNALAVSYDGVFWQGVGGNMFDTVGDIAWAEELQLFVATGGLSATSVAWSSDGLTWVSVGTPVWKGDAILWSRRLGRFLIGGERGLGLPPIVFSSDGKAYTAVTSMPTSLQNCQGVYAIGESASLGRFVATGYGDKGYIWYSDDGIAWHDIVGDNPFSGCCAGGAAVDWSPIANGFFAASTTPNQTAFSSDGITWVGQGSQANVHIDYFGGKIVSDLVNVTTRTTYLFSDTMSYVTSASSGTWTSGFFPFAPYGGQFEVYCRDLAYSPILDMWVAVGHSPAGSFAHSKNTSSWTIDGFGPFNSRAFMIAVEARTPIPIVAAVTAPQSVSGSSVVYKRTSVTVSADSAQSGSLFVLGGLNVSASTVSANVNISFFSAPLTMSVGSLLKASSALKIDPGTPLTLRVTQEPVVTGRRSSSTITATVATYGTVEGTFDLQPSVMPDFANANCYTFDAPTAVYGPSTLSITVGVTPLCTTTSTSTAPAGTVHSGPPGGTTMTTPPQTQSSALSTGAIVGICVGAVAAGVLLALGIFGLRVARRKQWTSKLKNNLRQAALEDAAIK
jgi:hypothetical protein